MNNYKYVKNKEKMVARILKRSKEDNINVLTIEYKYGKLCQFRYLDTIKVDLEFYHGVDIEEEILDLIDKYGPDEMGLTELEWVDLLK